MKISSELLHKLSLAEKIVLFTGAGVSAGSGIPTFRGNDGIWKKMKPEELANFDAFIKNPDLVWEWYLHRKKIMTSINPNAGHIAIMELEKYFSVVNVITQNIDNLHFRAGSKNVFELHGNIERNFCIGCKTLYSNDQLFAIIDKKNNRTPHCITCNGLIRPDVVWFGESLQENIWKGAVTSVKQCDVFFSVGTSSIVYPAASLIEIARQYSAYIVEVNTESTEMSYYADECIIAKSEDFFPLLINEISITK